MIRIFSLSSLLLLLVTFTKGNSILINDSTTLCNSDKEDGIIRVYYYSHSYKIIYGIVNSIPLVVGLIGNTLVCIVIVRSKVLQSSTNCYLLSLAVSDLFSLIFGDLILLVGINEEREKWLYGSFACKVWIILQYMLPAVSALSITAFSVERYLAICHPTRAHGLCFMQRSIRVIIAIWLFCLVIYAPRYSFNELSQYNQIYVCQPINDVNYQNINRIMYFVDFFVFFCTPLLTTLILYSLISYHLYASHDQIKVMQAGGEKSSRSFSERLVQCFHRKKKIIATRNHAQASLNKKQTRNKRKVIKMLITVVVFFAIQWFPQRIAAILQVFQLVQLDYWFMLFSRNLCYINSAVNPFLYNYMSKRFRRAFKSALRLRLKCS